MTNCFAVEASRRVYDGLRFLKLRALSRDLQSVRNRKCTGPMVNQEFELVREQKRPKLNDQQKSWERR
jgi:hypothetical protein